MDKRDRLHKALDDACDYGLGEFNIKIKEDGEFFILDIRYKTNPSDLDISDAVSPENRPFFGGIEITDGDVRFLKRKRSIKI